MKRLPSTMKALQMREGGQLVMTDLPVPEPGPRDVLVRTLAATICTSDLHDIDYNPFGIVPPRVLGHEAAGVVAACGAEVRDFTPGDRAAVHPVLPCGKCESCLRGFGHLCSNMGHLGLDRDGAFAEYFVQRADRVRRLPDEMPATTGALLEPVAVCLQAISRSGNAQGRDILVVGDGPFGNIISRLAIYAGAKRVMVIGREPFRLNKIPGVKIVEATPDASVDVAILAVSSAEAVTTCLAALRPRGRLVVFSALSKNLPIDMQLVHQRELEIVGACNDEERLDEAMACLCNASLGLGEIVTHQIPFQQWPEAFALAKNGHDRALKVALTFPEAP